MPEQKELVQRRRPDLVELGFEWCIDDIVGGKKSEFYVHNFLRFLDPSEREEDPLGVRALAPEIARLVDTMVSSTDFNKAPYADKSYWDTFEAHENAYPLYEACHQHGYSYEDLFQ